MIIENKNKSEEQLSKTLISKDIISKKKISFGDFGLKKEILEYL